MPFFPFLSPCRMVAPRYVRPARTRYVLSLSLSLSRALALFCLFLPLSCLSLSSCTLLCVVIDSLDVSPPSNTASFIKDGECDVDLNNAECMWDGGDCEWETSDGGTCDKCRDARRPLSLWTETIRCLSTRGGRMDSQSAKQPNTFQPVVTDRIGRSHLDWTRFCASSMILRL